jgi:DNA-binding transcriptional ArsR family regulator
VERLPRQTRFYPRDFSDEESVVARALRRKTPRDIIYTLMLNNGDSKKGLDFSQIVSDVSKSPSTVSLYLSQLIKDNIVTITLDFGRKRKYHLSNKQLVDRLIEDHKSGMFEKPVSGFEDMINSL